MKMWVVFEKRGALKHIGHLDLMRAMQRALRRSGLQVKYSQGYNPHILLNFAAPLSVGCEGLREVMEVPLAGPCAGQVFQDGLNQALPPLLQVLEARLVEDTQGAPMALLGAAIYHIQPLAHFETLRDHLAGFLALPSVVTQRKSKKGMVDIDLRPLIYNLLPREHGFEAVLALREAGTCKPELLMQQFAAFAGVDMPEYQVTRTQLLTEALAPLEQA